MFSRPDDCSWGRGLEHYANYEEEDDFWRQVCSASTPTGTSFNATDVVSLEVR